MSDILKKIGYIFEKKQKTRMFWLFVAIFLGAVLELVGVSLIMPLIQIISDPSKVRKNPVLNWMYTEFSITSMNDFFVLLVILIIFVYIVKNIYLIIMYYYQYSFIYNNQLKIEGRLIDCYLKKPYTYHLNHNTSNMIRNIMLDSERLFQLILTVLNVASEMMLSLLLILYLLSSDPVITVTIAVLLAACMGIYQLLTKKKVNRYGQINQEYDGKMHQSINQALGAVKDI